MNADYSHQLLQRLGLEELERAAELALQAKDYERACELLREAARRAPFRQDLREMLAIAVEGRLASPAPPRGASQSPLEAFRARATSPASPRSATPPRPESGPAPIPTWPLRPAEEPPEAPGEAWSRRPAADAFVEPEPSLEPAPGGRSSALFRAASAPMADRRQRSMPSRPGPSPLGAPKASARPRSGQFERRHQRGPLSAILFGAFVGMAMLCLVGGGGWYYMKTQGLPSIFEGSSSDASRQAQLEDKIKSYLEQGQYSLAIDRLEELPPSKDRDRRLAAIYMEVGNQGFKQNPPRLASAQSAYGQAFQRDPDNPDIGVALAQADYALAGERDQGADNGNGDNQKYMNAAKETLQAVIARNPQCMPAYELLARVAIAQRDYALQQRAYQKIIENSPKDSPTAQQARDNLRSLGLKYDM